MDQDDPEKRTADLERGLTQAPSTGGGPQADNTTRGWLTREQVRGVVFGKPPMGSRGYNEDEVDAFVDAVDAALSDPARRLLTPEQVRNVSFSKPPIGKRGYNEDEVDAFLERVEEQLRAQQGGSAPRPMAEFRPPPTNHSKEEDGFEQMFGVDRKSFYLLAAIGILALLGLALKAFGDDIPALNKPAPSIVGLLFLAVPAVLVIFALIRNYRRKR